MQLDGIAGRVAFVTGAGRGIGRHIAETLRDLGAITAAGDLEAPTIPNVTGVMLDVADDASIERAFGEIEQAHGHVELLVLNAGIFAFEPFEETTRGSWDRMLAVNLTGAFVCAQRALPSMRLRGFGRIVAIGSSAGKTGGARSVAAYAVSKAGIMVMIKSIASEYARHGVYANAVAPAQIDTEMVKVLPDLTGLIPLGRLGKPQEVADVVAFLCSDHASFITGEVIDINGGFLID